MNGYLKNNASRLLKEPIHRIVDGFAFEGCVKLHFNDTFVKI